MSELMRETVLLKGDIERKSAMQLVMYGDPTLKRTAYELAATAIMPLAKASISRR
jgi:hypothetical protein